MLLGLAATRHPRMARLPDGLIERNRRRICEIAKRSRRCARGTAASSRPCGAGAATVMAVCGVAWTRRSARCVRNLAATLLVVATLMASPHMLDDDLRDPRSGHSHSQPAPACPMAWAPLRSASSARPGSCRCCRAVSRASPAYHLDSSSCSRCLELFCAARFATVRRRNMKQNSRKRDLFCLKLRKGTFARLHCGRVLDFFRPPGLAAHVRRHHC